MWKHFDFVFELFLNLNESVRDGKSYAAFARFLGLSVGKVQKWRELEQWPKAPDLAVLHAKLGLSYRWLVTGEGEPFDETPPAQTAPAPVQEQVLPADSRPPQSAPPATPLPQNLPPTTLIGFASCSVFGWQGTMTIPVSVEPPSWHEGMVAVMASGESMLPAGIGHGHICYCDTTKAPGINEAVYVETTDGLGTIKLFCGWSDRGGERYLNLQGWQDKQPGAATQKTVNVDIIDCHVRRIAPVIYVRRRL